MSVVVDTMWLLFRDEELLFRLRFLPLLLLKAGDNGSDIVGLWALAANVCWAQALNRVLGCGKSPEAAKVARRDIGRPMNAAAAACWLKNCGANIPMAGKTFE